MEKGNASKTAQGAAFMRAAHLVLDDDPKIFEDTVALAFIGQKGGQGFRRNRKFYMTSRLVRARAFVVLRSRYTEDRLEDAMGLGTDQYVILGAGLDSFAYRREDLSDRVKVFEIDHPDTQEWKKDRFESLGLEHPDNLTFVPFDFEKETLEAALARSGYDFQRPAFFSWLGVTQYLSQEAVFGTFKEVASISAPGSEMVFQYCVPQSVLDEENREYLKNTMQFGASCGEPWLSLFEPEGIAKSIREMGYDRIEDFSPDKAFDTYFSGRSDGLYLPQTHRLMKAGIG